MTKAVAKQQGGQVADYGSSLLEVIAKAARDPDVDVDKMERLFAMQERVEARAAKLDYTAAKLAMRPELPTITQRGHIIIRDKNDQSKILQDTPFARFEDIQEAIEPVLLKHGFDLEFKNGLSDEGKVRVTTILTHAGGHSESTYFDLPHDSSGSKNAVQAVGSSTSYAKRYGVLSILNIRVAGEDDDAERAIPSPELPDAEWAKMQQLIAATSANVPAMLAHLKIRLRDDNLSTLSPEQYERVIDALQTKLARITAEETNAQANGVA